MAPNIDEETGRKIQELQILEQNYQALLMQKQAFQLESNELKNALEEVEKSKGDAFKVIGQVMVKTDKKVLKKDISEKQELLTLRLKSINKQETSLREDIERIRSDVVSRIQ
ncbi:MAG: prefoldin subunit [Candidatus Pacearchaeota archaeon]